MTDQTRARGRPRLFDEEATLDVLTGLFWEKGFARTSMLDLVEASGVYKSSLYGAFGTKEELFAKILRRYMAARIEMFTELIQISGSGIDGIHNFLELLRTEATARDTQAGCLLVHTSSELCGTTPGFENFGVEFRKAIKDQLRQLIAQAGPDQPAESRLTQHRTNLFATFMLGLDSTNRGGADGAEIGELIDAMHSTVETWRS